MNLKIVRIDAIAEIPTTIIIRIPDHGPGILFKMPLNSKMLKGITRYEEMITALLNERTPYFLSDHKQMTSIVPFTKNALITVFVFSSTIHHYVQMTYHTY